MNVWLLYNLFKLILFSLLINKFKFKKLSISEFIEKFIHEILFIYIYWIIIIIKVSINNIIFILNIGLNISLEAILDT